MAKEYKVSLEVALKKFAASEQFRQHLRSGQYLYVEKRICLNQPKYIHWDAAAVSLTDYAREHQDECCLSPRAFASKVQKTKKTGDRFVVRTHNRTPYTAQNRRSRVWCHKLVCCSSLPVDTRQ